MHLQAVIFLEILDLWAAAAAAAVVAGDSTRALFIVCVVMARVLAGRRPPW